MSDGAAVMIGYRTGVSTLLQHQKPNLLSVHCTYQRLPLAAAQATAEITYVKKFKEIQADQIIMVGHWTKVRTFPRIVRSRVALI